MFFFQRQPFLYKKGSKDLIKRIVMRLQLISLIVFIGCLQVSASSFAQLKIKANNMPLKEVMKQIENQSGMVFMYNNTLLKTAKPVTITVNNASLESTLQRIFQDQPLNYKIIDKTISLSAKIKSEKTDNSFVDVQGVVLDEEGKPLPGVTVLAQQSGQRTATDAAGRFKLANVDSRSLLVFSAIGYETYTVRVFEKSTKDIVVYLKPSLTSLKEVVMIGYGSMKKRDLTGSVASIDVNEVKNAPFISIDQAMAGKAAGVQVMQADGSPGGMAKIRIRGGSSLIGGNDPLYVIDGVQLTLQNRYMQGGADLINPNEIQGSDRNYGLASVGNSFSRGLNGLAGLNINDIETIDILKDASATAIYGSRAANGVVIITTKKGKTNQKPVLEANYYAGLSSPITEKVLNADQYKEHILDGARNLNSFLTEQGRAADVDATRILNDPSSLGTANTDWMKLVTRNGRTQNADISVRGGGTGSKYYTSLAYARQTGTLVGTDFSRISGKVSLDNDITARLRIISNLDYSFTKNNITNGTYASAQFIPPTFEPYNADGTPAVFNRISFFNNLAFTGIQNPVAMLQGINKSETALLLGSLALEYDILRDLKFRSTASVNYSNYHQLNYIPSTLQVYSTNQSLAANGGIGTQGQTQQSDVFYENTLTWDKTFNEKHRLNMLVGTSWQQTNSKSFTAGGQGFPDDTFLNGLSSAATALAPTAAEAQSSLLSFYLRANYAFKDRYLFTVTARSDESSKFPKNNRIGYFPSFGVAWRAKEESFLKDVSWLDELKFRLGAGYTGTQNIGNNLFYTLYTPVSYGGANALIPSQLGNDKIKWESTLQKDAGIDFAMFSSRLSGSIGYYEKYTSGLLMSRSVPTSTGFVSSLVNFADISNKGLEVDLRAELIRKKDFSWNLAVNVSGNRSKVSNIGRDFQDPNTVAQADPFFNQQVIGNTVLREGQSVGLIYGYQYLGVIKTQEQLAAYKAENFFAQVGAVPYLGIGSPMYALEKEGDYKGFYSRNVIGNAQPDFYGGITNSLSYKQFSLMTLFTYSYGGDLLYLPEVNSIGQDDLGNRNTRSLLPYFTPQAPNSDRPTIRLKESNHIYTDVSNLQVHDASYIKLKSVTLNYQLADKLTKRLGLRSAMVYVSGSNLLAITNYPGPDPEVSNDPFSLINGYTDNATYPSMRQYTFGVRFGF